MAEKNQGYRTCYDGDRIWRSCVFAVLLEKKAFVNKLSAPIQVYRVSLRRTPCDTTAFNIETSRDFIILMVTRDVSAAACSTVLSKMFVFRLWSTSLFVEPLRLSNLIRILSHVHYHVIIQT